MIGFEITATSNIGFNPLPSSAWTEGSLWLAKAALFKKPKGTAMFTADFTSAIAGEFGKIKDVLLKQVGAIGNEFLLIVKGDIMLSMRFDPKIPAYMNTWHLVRNIALNDTDLGDQVMIHLCKLLIAFDEYITIFGFTGNIIPLLTIDLKL